jgi:hypothetical protein
VEARRMAAGQQPAQARTAHRRQPAGRRVDRPYPREGGRLPRGKQPEAREVLAAVGRVDNVYGDRNLFCSCVAVLLGLAGFSTEPDTVDVDAVPGAAGLHGSLGATGKGHGSDKAVLLGLLGQPDTVDRSAFDETDLKVHRRETLPFHANGMRFTAFDGAGRELADRCYYSVGGGFVVSDEVAADGARQKVIAPDTTVLPLPFHSGAELLALCAATRGSASPA